MSSNNALNAVSSLTNQSIRQAKRALRKQMATQLAKIPKNELIQQSNSVTQHVLNHPVYKNANSVSIYVSMDQGEVRTEELCKQTLLLGKRLYVPRFAKVTSASTESRNQSEDKVNQVGGSTTEAAQKATFDTDMRMLRVNDWEDYQAMVMNRWGIREPDEKYRQVQREDGELHASRSF